MLLRDWRIAHNAGVDVRLELERVLYRVQLSAVELQLQPELFQATEELRIASGELASVIEEIISEQKHSSLYPLLRAVPHARV